MAPQDTSEHLLETFQATFWAKQIAIAEDDRPDIKHAPLPLARIKKVMKSDPDVKMISADAPLLFAKACEIFISELTARAYMIAESHKRRTVTRADISQAAGQSDTFDFLIDFLPPDERKNLSSAGTARRAAAGSSKGQENIPNHSDDHKPALSALPTTSSSKQKKMPRASSHTPQQVDQPIDGATIPTSVAVAESSSSMMDGVEPTHTQEPREKPESPQQHVKNDASVSNPATQRSEDILREAGSPETNVFYEQIQTYISAPRPPQTRLPLPPSRHSASSRSHSHSQNS